MIKNTKLLLIKKGKKNRLKIMDKVIKLNGQYLQKQIIKLFHYHFQKTLKNKHKKQKH